MREYLNDIWCVAECSYPDAVVVTTNGFVTKAKCNVMGAGIAKQAKARFPNIDYLVGCHLIQNGNVPGVFDVGKVYKIVTFPTKPVLCFNGQPGWKSMADMNLIISSLGKLLEIVDANHWSMVYMPRPGCGRGELTWTNGLREMFHNALDDRFIVFDNNSNGWNL